MLNGYIYVSTMVTFILQSVDFHERGKRHQENVKKLLSSVSLRIRK